MAADPFEERGIQHGDPDTLCFPEKGEKFKKGIFFSFVCVCSYKTYISQTVVNYLLLIYLFQCQLFRP